MTRPVYVQRAGSIPDSNHHVHNKQYCAQAVTQTYISDFLMINSLRFPETANLYQRLPNYVAVVSALAYQGFLKQSLNLPMHT